MLLRITTIACVLALTTACGKKAPAPTPAAPDAAAAHPDEEPPVTTTISATTATTAPDAAMIAPPDGAAPDDAAAEFPWVVERFADIRVLRFQVPGFDQLTPRQRVLLYYLYEAGLSGYDITWDQNHPKGLLIRHTLEAIDRTYAGAREGDDWKAFQTWLRRVWFAHGVHHHSSTEKMTPELGADYFLTLVKGSDAGALPLAPGQTPEALAAELTPLMFDPTVDTRRVSLDTEGDLVVDSANNFYGPGITQADVEAFYAARKDADDPRPILHGLNSQLVRGPDGKLVERVWKVGGMYGPAIERIVGWLEKAITVAETPTQREALERLVAYYRSGDLADFDAYSIAWVGDTDSPIDNVNGFIETYGDAMDMRGSFEAMVSFRDAEATRRIAAISDAASWFEARSPIADAHRKDDVQGISAKVITVVSGAGDAAPAFPLGVNLPNSDWIRKEHGSKSVNLGNIAHAYDEASKASGLLEEFSPSPEVLARLKAHGALGDALHTDLHEVIGHASGRLEEGVAPDTLKAYAGTLEEARADLVALYFIMDQKLVELGVMPDVEVGRASYDDYIRNGLLTQLARVKPGDSLQQAHMRNRQLVSAWVFEKGAAAGVIERVTRDGKTYFAIRDYDALRGLFGQLLREVQRIKSQGDFEAGKALVEGYGVKVDRALHEEVLARYAKLGIAPYSGFLNPRLVPVVEDGEVVDARLEAAAGFAEQMHEYARKYAVLPVRPE